MSGLKNSTIGDFNALIEKQKTVPGLAVHNILTSRPMSKEWRRSVDEDYKKRGK